MPFGTFTQEMVTRDLGLTIREGDLFRDVAILAPAPDFLRALQPGIELAQAIDNEKSKSEFIIAPVLLALREILGRSFGLFSGVELTADSSRGLSGVCDFLLTKSPVQIVAQRPIIAIVEGKNDNIHNGLWQAIASAYAAGLVNQSAGQPLKATYGAVTTGVIWFFLKVEDSTVTFDSKQYLISDLGKIFGILKHIIETA